MAQSDGAKHIQLRRALEEELKSGGFKPGERFYSDQELMRSRGLSFSTVSRAMRDLAETGLIERRRRGGTFVAAARENIALEPLLVRVERVGVLDDVGPYNPVTEITRGIINHYGGPARIVDFAEFALELKRPGPKAAILINPREAAGKELVASGVPYVYVCQTRYHMPFRDCVSWDYEWGIAQMVDYLAVTLGHRKIAMLTTKNPRKEAFFRLAMANRGLAVRPEWMPSSIDRTFEIGRMLTRELLSLAERPTAIFAETDIRAVGAIAAVREAGLTVPDDVSVVGFDDFADAAQMDPPLTTVLGPYFEIGREAVRMLKQRVATGKSVDNVCLPSALVVRGSCAPPRAT